MRQIISLHWLKQMDIAPIIDRELAQPHGNRKGLSYGQLSGLFLSYVQYLNCYLLLVT